MGHRPKIPAAVETEVLTKSRRKCCLCYALHFDEQPKAGQIAHLDHDPTNNAPDNLAWLCFDHHDEYDSQTSQAKGLTIHEVKAHRQALYERIVLQEAAGVTSRESVDQIVKRFEELLEIRQQSSSNFGPKETERQMSWSR
jgi:hypothetical protein